MKIVPR